jgi:hypothetical protein
MDGIASQEEEKNDGGRDALSNMVIGGLRSMDRSFAAAAVASPFSSFVGTGVSGGRRAPKANAI